jgi:hypothetical protein
MDLYELYKKDPQTALDFVLERGEQSFKGAAHLLVSYPTKGSAEQRAGSYKFITRKMLEGRTYEIEYVDDWIGLIFTDAEYDPQLYKVVMK